MSISSIIEPIKERKMEVQKFLSKTKEQLLLQLLFVLYLTISRF